MIAGTSLLHKFTQRVWDIVANIPEKPARSLLADPKDGGGGGGGRQAQSPRCFVRGLSCHCQDGQ